MVAKCLHPHAQVIAIEPNPDTYAMLIANTELFGLKTMNLALGDGSKLSLKKRTSDMSVRDVFCESGDSALSIPSKRLEVIVRDAGVCMDKPYFIKVDCEGGERYLMNKESEQLIRDSTCTAFELHYKGTHWQEWPGEIWDFLLEWSDYKEWLNNCFSDTHNILIISNNIDFGLGTIHLLRKGVKPETLNIGGRRAIEVLSSKIRK